MNPQNIYHSFYINAEVKPIQIMASSTPEIAKRWIDIVRSESSAIKPVEKPKQEKPIGWDILPSSTHTLKSGERIRIYNSQDELLKMMDLCPFPTSG